MHNGIVNKTRYDDLRKPMKQTSFTVKNLRENLLEKQFTIVKKSFRSSTKPLSLDSTISIDELTEETFYRFRTFELFNIWTSTFAQIQYMTNSSNLKMLLATKFFTLSIMKIKKVLGYQTLWRKRRSNFLQRE